jgi:SAM-dependent methyltransferase
VLELGAGRGATLREAKRLGLAAYTVGIDLVEPTPAGASDDPCAPDRFLCGNVEDPGAGLAETLVEASFDAVVCADVLEHLVDPWSTVRTLARFLKPGGLFLSSIPNVRNHRLLRPILLHGDFRYEEAGLSDRTHLRFFCRKNVRDLFEGAGLVIDEIAENMGGYGRHHRLLDRLTLGLLHEFFVFQYRTKARRPPAAERGASA